MRQASVAPTSLVLLGHPVAHSLSPRFQNAALRARGIAAEYVALDVVPEALADTLAALRQRRAAGNVTLPHKHAVADACDVRTPIAARVGAVNTFWHEPDGTRVGDNTDVAGVHVAITALLGVADAPSRIVLLGAGGSAAAVVAACDAWPAAEFAVHARTLTRIAALQHSTARALHVIDDGQLETAVRAADLVINATPVGLRDDAMPVPVAWLDDGAAVLDLVYRPGRTAWVRGARARGLAADDGLRMLVAQGAASFGRWFGDPVPEDAMWAALEARP